jgi:hypothetical protein
VVKNFSLVHAKLKVLASIRVDDQLLKLPNDHLYDGSYLWEVQAHGHTDLALHGHLSLPHMFKFNGLKYPAGSSPKPKSLIRLESWAINYWDGDADFKSAGAKNPVLEWYWDMTRKQWILEVCPGHEQTGG